MMFLFRRHADYDASRGRGAVQSSMLLTGVLSLVFGLAIIAAPELLAYIVASFFIVTGVSILLALWNMR